MSLSSADVNAALRDKARDAMTDGPAKTLLDRIAAYATGDYDPDDVIVLVVKPPAITNLDEGGRR